MRLRGRFDRGTLRAAGFVAVLTVVFLVTNTAVAAAADSGADSGGGLLAPLDVTTSEGVPLNGYSLEADGGSVTDITSQFQTLVLGGLFTLVRLLVGLSCWMVQFTFRFPLIRALLAPAQKASEAYNTHVVGALGLKALLLGWAFIFGVVLLVRGKVGKGLGEIVLTLLIAAFAASAFIRPDYILGADGPLDQTHQASLEVAQITTASYFGKKYDTSDPCDVILGPAQSTCQNSDAAAKAVSQPIQDALTNALVVKPYMLLEYGRILNPKSADDKAAYAVHLAWVAGAYNKRSDSDVDDLCDSIPGPAKDVCKDDAGSDKGNCGYLIGSAKDLCEKTSTDQGFGGLTKDLSKAGAVGKDAAEYAKTPSWDRVGGVVLLLVAVAVAALMVCSMAMVQLGTQGADIGAAAVGGIAWVWGMLPGPSRMAVWRWFGIFIVSVMVGFVSSAAIPMFAIGVDTLLTANGPDLMVERLLLLDGLAIGFLAFHRRLMAATSQFGSRLALRMRYAKVGGTHLPGDTSELGAALAMNGPGGGGGAGGLLGGPSGAHMALGARHRILGNLAAMADGTGMPADPGRLLSDAMAEGRRGLAPVGLGLAGARLALRGAHGALIGPKPAEEDESVKLLRNIAKGVNGEGPHGHGGPGGPGRPSGPGGGGKSPTVDPWTGEILHDPETDRPLLGSRIHQKASRLRGYRIASRAARIAYGATSGLPRNIAAARGKASEFTQDARTQLRVVTNQVRQDAEDWQPVRRAAMAPVDRVSQHAATAWQVYDPAGATRRVVRDTAAGAAMYTSPSATSDPGPRPESSTERVEPVEDVNRRRVFDELMRLQRRTWDTPPSWGGGDDE